jgi:hypothetical protein
MLPNDDAPRSRGVRDGPGVAYPRMNSETASGSSAV